MATTLNYVECAHCKKKNPQIKSLETCRNCGAPLPWAKTQATKTKAAPPSHSRIEPAMAAIDWGFWGVMAFSFFAPPIGYFLYRSYAESGDEKAGAAGLGASLGLVSYVGRFLLKMNS